MSKFTKSDALEIISAHNIKETMTDPEERKDLEENNSALFEAYQHIMEFAEIK